VLNPWESGRISFLFAYWMTHTQGQSMFGFSHLSCKKQYKNYNTITVHLEFLQILQIFFKLHQKMLNIQKYDFDEI
jgi:hypothetical protein